MSDAKPPHHNQHGGKTNHDKSAKSPLQGFRDFLGKHQPPIKEVVRETTSGGVVFRHGKSGAVEILLIQDAKKRWTIPKGHVEPGEEHGATAEREIIEETGLPDVEAHSYLGKVHFRYRRENTLVLMTMHIWLVAGKGNTERLNPEDWLSNIKWFPSLDAVDKIAYDDIGKLMLLGMKKIRQYQL
jgi:8-oxo-dGTP pyrophosphatase MutT (NUDIX family)